MRKAKKLRIFFAVKKTAAAGLTDSSIWHNNLLVALRGMGHEVIVFSRDIDAYARLIENAGDKESAVLEKRPEFEATLLKEVTSAHREAAIDVFFSYFQTRYVTADTVAEIRSLGILAVNWYCNASYQFDLVAPIAAAYDYCLVPEKFRIPDYLAIGARPIYCQEAADPDFYQPYPLTMDFDVTFVGQRYGNRPDYVRHLLRHGVDIRVWGLGWLPHPPTLPLWRRIGSRVKRFLLADESLFPISIPTRQAGPPVSDLEMVQMYSRSRVNLGFSSVADTTTGIKQVRLRDFEVPMSGGFYMTEYMDELAEFFEYGKEIIGYHDRRDLLNKIRYYLAHKEERERIRAAGRRRAIAEHTWQTRLGSCFTEMGIQ